MPRHCYTKGTGLILCGNLGEKCVACGWVGEFLCDYPVGDGKTCDRSLCEEHAHEVGPDLHYCADHYLEWERFRKSGGVEKALKNVIPYSASQPKGADR